MNREMTNLLNIVLQNKVFKVVAIVLSIFFIYKAGENFGEFLRLALN